MLSRIRRRTGFAALRVGGCLCLAWVGLSGCREEKTIRRIAKIEIKSIDSGKLVYKTFLDTSELWEDIGDELVADSGADSPASIPFDTLVRIRLSDDCQVSLGKLGRMGRDASSDWTTPVCIDRKRNLHRFSLRERWRSKASARIRETSSRAREQMQDLPRPVVRWLSEDSLRRILEGANSEESVRQFP